MITSDSKVVCSKLVDVMGPNSDAEGDNSRVRAILVAGEGDAVVLASWATSSKVALMVCGEFDTVQGPTEGHSEMCDILILLKMKSVFVNIV